MPWILERMQIKLYSNKVAMRWVLTSILFPRWLHKTIQSDHRSCSLAKNTQQYNKTIHFVLKKYMIEATPKDLIWTSTMAGNFLMYPCNTKHVTCTMNRLVVRQRFLYTISLILAVTSLRRWWIVIATESIVQCLY